MSDSVPQRIWEIVKTFSELARGRDDEVQAACQNYLAGQLQRYRVMKRAVPVLELPERPPRPCLQELLPNATAQERAKFIGERDTYYATCEEYMAEAGQHARTSASQRLRWEAEHPESEDATVGRAVARLVCAAGHIVAQSEPDTASEAGLWRWRPETDGLSDVVWALLVDPDNWEGEEKRLIAALDCVKREWGVADAIERLKDREAKRKPKRGRPPKYDDDASRDALMVCSAWDRASDAGIPKQLFCKDRGLEPGKLDSYLRHRRRERAKR